MMYRNEGLVLDHFADFCLSDHFYLLFGPFRGLDYSAKSRKNKKAPDCFRWRRERM